MKPSMRRVTAAALCCVLLTVTAPATAQSRDEVTAEAMFLQGRQAIEAGNYRAACPKFAESQRLDPAAGTLMNLAACEEQIGLLASAWQHWKEAIDGLSQNDTRVSFARSRVEDLEKKLPRISVTLSPVNSAAARVFRDDIELGRASWGVPLPIDPGDHAVTVLAPGRLAERVTFSISEAEQKQIVVHSGAPDPAAVYRARGSTGEARRTIGWLVGTVGAAGVVTVAVTGALLVQDKSTVDANCPNKACLNQKGLDAAANGKTLVVANTAAVIVSAVGLGVGAYLILSSAHGQSMTAIAPSVGPGSAALTCAGTF